MYALLAEPHSLPLSIAAVQVSNWVWTLALGLMPLLFLLLPRGRLLSHRWRRIAVFAVLLYVALPVGYALLPEPPRTFPSQENPPGREGAAGEIVPGVEQGLAFMVLLLTILISLVLRFRRSRGEEHQQIKQGAYAGALIVAYLLVHIFFQETLDAVNPIFNDIVFGSLWIVIGVAILHYRLYDIDLIVNRMLVYGALTAVLALVYFGSVVLLQNLFRTLTGQES